MSLEEILRPLRDQIDQTDRQLIQLIKQRISLVEQVGQAKHKFNAPVYAPDREKKLYAKGRALAEEIGVNYKLINDIQRRLVEESYAIEEALLIGTCDKSVCIVGGASGIGQRFVKEFLHAGCRCTVLDVNDWSQAEKLLDVDAVIVAVPIHITVAVIRRLQPYLKPHQLLADFTSIKQKSVEAMLEVHQGPIIGLHPMFGPDVYSMSKQVMLVSGRRDPQKSQWLIDIFQQWKMLIEIISPQDHDHYMSYIQASRHFNSFVIGKYLQSSNLDLDLLRRISSPIYYLDLSLIGRLFAQNSELYADIIFDRESNKEVIQALFNEYQQAISLLMNNDKQGFIDKFNSIKEYFGSDAELFLQESARFIYTLIEQRNL